jgi:RNA polymerase sigma factor (TIGR02999 family)
VDLARRTRYQKRGGRLRFVRLSEERLRAPDPGKDLAALEEALERLARIDPRCSRVVELRYFRGLSVEETATVIQVSRDTVMRDWAYARAWLLRELLPATPGSLRPRRSGSRPQHN